MIRCIVTLACVLASTLALAAEPLPGTGLLQEERPLDVVMVEGIDRFALRELAQSRELRESRWQPDYRTLEAYEKSLLPARQRFAKIIGVVDRRVEPTGIELIGTTESPSLVAQSSRFTIHAVRWRVLEGVTAEGLLLRPSGKPIARVVALGDADWTPEMLAGLRPGATPFGAELAAQGCEVLVPTLVNRDSTFSANSTIGRKTNLTHREFIYRQAFEMGRHIIGYEVQKVLAAVDQFELRNRDTPLPTAVVGVSEGGLLALYSAAVDQRIDAAIVSGYFDERERIWNEPIYRNVWNLLSEFGDSELAGLIAPRFLFIETNAAIPVVDGPPTGDRKVAAPGVIQRLEKISAGREARRASLHWSRLRAEIGELDTIKSLIRSPDKKTSSLPLQPKILNQWLAQIAGTDSIGRSGVTDLSSDARVRFSPRDRQRRQVQELVDYTQRVLQLSHRVRERRFSALDRRSVEKWVASAEPLRQQIWQQLFGQLPTPTMPANPRSRKILDTPDFTGYEVVLDVYPEVIAAGILLLPKEMLADEKRPVVVCQHGLEGQPMDTISGPDSSGYRAYKSFSAELARRGFIVYAPQNPYRGKDAFRTLQRKSNPLGRSLFSYIIPQHLVTLRWLADLPNVDSERIAFYGLSYGGKTAMRVPPMLPTGGNEPGYCLSICSADFNEWVAKNASTDAPFSYLWTGEYEIFEWNMGHLANYAELGMLMTPRPFMVERGHDDGVGIDEWVAWEYAKIRRHYNKLGIGDRTEIEFFNGPHTINGKKTYEFLHHHLSFDNRNFPRDE